MEIINNINFTIIVVGIILFISVYASKLSEKIGIPLLLVFLGIGMLLGSEGIVGIEFDNVFLAQIIGMIALIFILYSGGLDTFWEEIKPVMISGVILATLGVLLTALIMACFIYLVLDFTFLESMLLGSIISSTDAAAVFMILRSQKIKLKNNIGPLLELESGSNDPMAIFLTITILQLIFMPQTHSIGEWILQFIAQFAVGGVLGILCGYLFPKICQHINISQAGLYPLISVAWLFMIFGVSSFLNGNGYLSIYLAGIITNKYAFPNKSNIIAFHDAIAWMMQIVVFLVLGLLVFPSQLPDVAIQAFVLAFILIFLARPLSVFISLYKSKYNKKEKIYISWVGLRGAVPIILATYPYVYKFESSSTIFNIVFFMVIISVLLQGVTISFMAKKLDLIE
ncbi:potassium/proton antiporter [Helicobacter mesocricetorum]|uniref:potassium/proton antiporter n=1 Tax=Helicobacter mesocricetorum TaxID=87012 RepID=UPI001F1ADB27|nr:potassium/proton antiporter [Helicobacter mesocricetorum]